MNKYTWHKVNKESYFLYRAPYHCIYQYGMWYLYKNFLCIGCEETLKSIKKLAKEILYELNKSKRS